MAKQHRMTRKYGGKNGSFTAKIASYSENLEDTVNAAVLALYGNLIKDTPVGNPSIWKSKPPKGYVGGTARANWKIVETPDDKVINSTSIPDTPSLPRGWSKLYIINNVSWIIPLEYGHSTQIEEGWIRKNVDRFQQIVREVLSERS